MARLQATWQIRSAVAAVRRFNRFYTQRLGVLRDGWLDSPFSLTEARVLYEITQRDRATATDIGRDLGLDAGYLSRILRRFHKKRTDPQGRLAGRRPAELLCRSPRRAERPSRRSKRAPNSRSARCSARLAEPEQDHLVAAMRTIETHDGVRTDRRQARSSLRQPRPGDLGWVVPRHAELYAQEYGWAENFEGVCAQIVADFANNYDPTARALLDRRDGRPDSSARCSW